MTAAETCPTCNGSGRIAVGPWGRNPATTICPECGGKKIIPVPEIVPSTEKESTMPENNTAAPTARIEIVETGTEFPATISVQDTVGLQSIPWVEIMINDGEDSYMSVLLTADQWAEFAAFHPAVATASALRADWAAAIEEEDLARLVAAGDALAAAIR